MSGFASYDELISKIAAGQFNDYNPYKVGGAMQAAGVWYSLWRLAGAPGAGADPATTPGTQHTKTAGSVNFPDVSPAYRHAVSMGAVANQNATLMIYDRLCSVSGITLNATGNKTINSSALPRYSGAAAVDVQAWLEVTTATTTTAPIVSLNSYTNQDGTAARAGATLTFPSAATVLNAFVGPLPLQSGDLGIRSVEVGLNVATAAAAGVCNLVLLKPIAYLPLIANQWNERDLVMQLAAMPRIYDGATLAYAVLASSSTSLQMWGNLRTAYN